MDNKTVNKIPEVWGGIECTINRVGDQFKDQLEYSGHYNRIGDLEVIGQLGIKAIRYPVLWEKHQPQKNQNINWNWTDGQLEYLRYAGMSPIAGLLHHGSGPMFTNLLDPEFPYLLASYAYEVASRYPWLEYYTPVNEPLTTARFSGLYGLWYPHHHSERSFYKMLINQLKGTVLAMEAIRSVNPAAKLVQTEDLGKTHSTPALAYQANFENVRRLLTFDILTGKLTSGHPHYEYILGCGISKEDLAFFESHQIRPNILGLNYYITSERWIDESLEKYHPVTHGGNGQHQYADTEIVRVNNRKRDGLKKLTLDIWERYHIPLAITEAHLHCTREEQLRWFKEIWDNATVLVKEGVNLKAVTAWALLGSFDWDTLLTKTGTQYESGVFDIKTLQGQLRPTALVNLVKSLANGEQKFHPVLSESGWWRDAVLATDGRMPTVLIVEGDSSQENTFESKPLSSRLQKACDERRIGNLVVNNIEEIDLDVLKPWAVIAVNEMGTHIPAYCAAHEIQYVTFSSSQDPGYGLQVIADRKHMTIHQINKVLDLMIDGDQGYWVFDSGEIIYKADDFIRSR